MWLVPTCKAVLQRSTAGNMLQISQMCWQNLTAGVFNGLWASTHVLSDEPSHAWQSSVLLAQLGTGCSLHLPSAPVLPTSPGLGRQHWFYVYNMQQGSHHSSQGLFCCPQQSVTVLPKSLPCLPVLFFLAPHSMSQCPQRQLRPHPKRSAQCAGCFGGDTKCL